MVAIRRDEDLDNIHSVYVDQWDWEKIISKEERSIETLKETVRTIYSVLRKTEKYMAVQYDYIEEILPKDIFFITSEHRSMYSYVRLSIIDVQLRTSEHRSMYTTYV